MKAAVVTSYSTPPEYADFPEPEAKPGDTMITVSAAALHPIVRSLANGKHYGATGEFPFVAGVDGVGRDAEGRRVLFGAARPPYGTMAEKCIAMPDIILPLPDKLDDVTAAAICNPGMSGWAALERAKFQPGESVLILGATGSAGRLAVQVARRRGLRHITAAGRNAKVLAELTSLGADRVISLEQPQEQIVAELKSARAELGFDIVLDFLWGAPAEAAIAAISQKGLRKSSGQTRYVQIGQSAGPNITMPAAALRSTDLHILGTGYGSASFDELSRYMKLFLAEAAENPFVFATRTAPLADVTKLWDSADDSARLVFQIPG